MYIAGVYGVLTLRLGVDNHFWDHGEEEVLDQSEGEAGLGPVVAPLENLEHIAIEFNFTVKVLLLKRLKRNLLLAVVGVAVLGLVELEVVLDGLAGKLGLFVLAGSEFRCQPPEGAENGKTQDKGKEEPGLEAHAPAPGDVGGDAYEQRDEDIVVERFATGAFCGARGICNSRVLLIGNRQLCSSSNRRSMAGGVVV
jgi:hypothetical protein